MLLSQVTGPTIGAVSISEAKAAAVVDFSDDDVQISGMIDAATRAVGEMAGRVLVAETWAASFGDGQSGTLRLPKSPVQSLTSITYYDADDVQQTADLNDFYLFRDDDVAYVCPKSGANWPTANSDRADAITVTFVAGYTSIPRNLKQAVLMMTAHFYENRSATMERKMAEVPLGVEHLVSLDRMGWIK